VKRKGRSWWTRGGKSHVELLEGSLVAFCGLDLTGATQTTHPATWRDACRNCRSAIARSETPALEEAAT